MNTSPSTAHPLIEVASGFSAGIASTLLSHPLDLVKTRLQVGEKPATNVGATLRLLRHVYQKEGGPFALYRGLVPNLIGNSLSWACFFLCYERAKEVIRVLKSSSRPLGFHDFLLASGCAGSVTAVISNPIWVIKTRMLSSSASHAGAYPNLTHGVRQILETDGVRGFYAGLVPSLIGVSHGAVQFMSYEELKKVRRAGLKRDAQLKSTDYLILGGLSKVVAGAATYPYQVVRTRLQAYGAKQRYGGMLDAVHFIWKDAGVRGFYRGLAPNLLRVLPSSAVTFLVYERTRSSLSTQI